MDNNNINISNAIVAGLEVLNDREIKVRADLINDLATLKNLLININNGNLVIASPDRILPQDAKLPNEESQEK